MTHRRVVRHKTQINPDTLMSDYSEAPPKRNEKLEKVAGKAFDQIGSFSEKVAKPVRPAVDRFFGNVVPDMPSAYELEWAEEANWARMQQEPIRARRMLRASFIVIVALIAWSGFAQLDEVTRGDGKVIPSGSTRSIAASFPGEVKLKVKFGQEVKANQLLAVVGTSTVPKSETEVLGLRARVARLEALVGDKPLVMLEEVKLRAPEVALQEESHYKTSAEELRARLSGAEGALRAEVARSVAASSKVVSSRDILKKYEAAQMKLGQIGSGVLSDVEMEKARADVQAAIGERDSANASVAKAREEIASIQSSMANGWKTELTKATEELNALTGKGTTEYRSPVDGQVNVIYTADASNVTQGAKILDVVPLNDSLIIEAKVKPKDIAQLKIGQPARVKITAYDFAIYGALDGTLESIASDTIKDEQGEVFYNIRVKTQSSRLKKGNIVISPGMVAEVDVKTGKKSVLTYLLKPVIRGVQIGMTEK